MHGCLRVLKKINISRVSTASMSEIFFNMRREILYLQVAMYCNVLFMHIQVDTNEIPNHFTLHCERHKLFYYVRNHSNGDLM